MSELHYFNPGSEEAICSGLVNYTPSVNVQRMFKDLACLPLWYAAETDYVWVDDPIAVDYVAEKSLLFPDLPALYPRVAKEKDLPALTAAPWGLAPNCLHTFKRLKERMGIPLLVPEWSDDHKDLAGRQTTRRVLLRLKELLPDFPFPEAPQFCRSADEVIHYICSREDSSFVLKTPFSSSGRGLLWIASASRFGEKELQWVNSAIRKQGEVSIEPALDKVQDFALEFESDGKGKVVYAGLSVFGTQERGAYSGNILGTESYRESLLSKYVAKETLEAVKSALVVSLAEVYGSVYAGCLGVDMLLYRSSSGEIRIYPCVEVNMRQTMGMLAVHLSRRLAEQSAGHFFVRFEKAEGEVYRKHLSMQEQYPLVMESGRIVSGYLNLCPVTSRTCYWAYIVVS